MADDLTELFGEPISIYTRAQAIADGVLMDVSDQAKRFGIRVPVAITDGLYGALTQAAQTDAVRNLCVDLLLITMRQHITGASDSNRIEFAVKVPHLAPISAYVLCTPGDTAEPVLTVMLPHED